MLKVVKSEDIVVEEKGKVDEELEELDQHFPSKITQSDNASAAYTTYDLPNQNSDPTNLPFNASFKLLERLNAGMDKLNQNKTDASNYNDFQSPIYSSDQLQEHRASLV